MTELLSPLQEQLFTQQLVETTIIAPSWFCSRSVFHTAGPFDETGPGTPDDLMFFYRHNALGGTLAKVRLQSNLRSAGTNIRLSMPEQVRGRSGALSSPRAVVASACVILMPGREASGGVQVS